MREPFHKVRDEIGRWATSPQRILASARPFDAACNSIFVCADQSLSTAAPVRVATAMIEIHRPRCDKQVSFAHCPKENQRSIRKRPFDSGDTHSAVLPAALSSAVARASAAAAAPSAERYSMILSCNAMVMGSANSHESSSG